MARFAYMQLYYLVLFVDVSRVNSLQLWVMLTVGLCVCVCVSAAAEWCLTDSPAGCVVDTIKEPSNAAQGGSDFSTHTWCNCSLSCGQKSFTNHVNKYPWLCIAWFFTPSTSSRVLFLWPLTFKMISVDAGTM